MKTGPGPRRQRKHDKKVEYVAGLIHQMFYSGPEATKDSPPNVWEMGREIRRVTGK